jgi:hypothetical protein
VDVVWLRNPIPFFQRYPDADILTSSDMLRSTVGKEEQLEKYPDAQAAPFNVGTYRWDIGQKGGDRKESSVTKDTQAGLALIRHVTICKTIG